MKEMKQRRVLVRTVGWLAIALGIVGLWYNLSGLPRFLRGVEFDPEAPYFLHAYLVMSLTCVACYVLLIRFGIQFVRHDLRHTEAFRQLMVFEVLYFLSIGLLWLLPDKIGMSIAAATGVANGGLMFQAFLLFPFWSPAAISKARKDVEKHSSNNTSEGICQPADGLPKPST
jgi:hypothetical protein